MIFFLDVPPDPALAEKVKHKSWLILVAMLALAAIIIFFIVRHKRKKEPGK